MGLERAVIEWIGTVPMWYYADFPAHPFKEDG